MAQPDRDAPSSPADHHNLLLGLSYRLLGSVSDAEDAVQECYERWYRLTPAQRADIISPRAWLTTTASRICLDVLKSARARRERYVGEWLPEPVSSDARWTSLAPTSAGRDPEGRVTMAESISMALLVLLEEMTPAERVALILHDVFDYRFTEIAKIVGRSPDACRQLASTARRRTRGARRVTIGRDQHSAAVRAFQLAWESGNVDALIATLDPGVRGVTDGGGRVSAATEPLLGARAVARFFSSTLERQPGLEIHNALVNGTAGLVATAHRETLAVVSFSTLAHRISAVWALRNPDKLTRWPYDRSRRGTGAVATATPGLSA